MELTQVENSSTSSSDSRPWLITVGIALALVVIAEVFFLTSAPAEPTALEKLNAAPGDDVFVYGNSMFQTGINFGPLAEQSQRDVVFDYHNGHYTSLWYLIADQALPLADPAPTLVVWGFRPKFAADPAFRQNKVVDNDLFEPGDSLYRDLTIGSGESVPLWNLAGQLREIVLESNGMWAKRDDAQAQLASRASGLGVDMVSVVRDAATEDFRERLASGEITVADEILRIATNGEIQLAEERVVDGQGDFIIGPSVDFAGSFLPHITEKISTASTQQLVIIWKPVHRVSDDVESVEDDKFVADAIAYFEQNDIPYVDLYHDDRITAEMFASGDHYNEDGRVIVTEILAAKLRELR